MQDLYSAFESLGYSKDVTSDKYVDDLIRTVGLW